ncbi:MAG TPA: MYXO-CTERM sorting domain-containing protein [Polyangiaceae bacterium]
MSATAFGAGEPCINDIDCPGGGNVCGGEVCNWNKPQGQMFTCNAAGTDAKKKDGWCTVTADCKCAPQGAKCVPPYCSFTLAADAPATGGGSPTGGSPGTAGTTSAAGTTSTAGTTSSGGTGAAPAPAPVEEEGGCSVRAPRGNTNGVALGLVGVLGLGYVLARRRR